MCDPVKQLLGWNVTRKKNGEYTTGDSVPSGRQMELFMVTILQDLFKEGLVEMEEINKEPKAVTIKDVPVVTKEQLDNMLKKFDCIEKSEATMINNVNEIESISASETMLEDDDDLVSEFDDRELLLVGTYSNPEHNNCPDCVKRLAYLIKIGDAKNGPTSAKCAKCLDTAFKEYKKLKKDSKLEEKLKRKEYLQEVNSKQYTEIMKSKEELSKFGGNVPSGIDKETMERIKRYQASGIVNLNLTIRN